MASGISYSEILLILAVMLIFIDAKQIPGLLRKIFKIIAQLRATVKKLLDDLDIK
ncbi:MAG: hypothetical protein FWB90_09055 [Fibromonadales bacterium]|nr:hypothetical protein [Fibromonadales bacterium]